MNILGAPTSLGNRPYEADGTARMTTLGPARLRQQGLVQRLGARDLGDVPAAAYRDFVRPPHGIRNEDLVLDHVREIARVLEAQNDFTLILSGDCSVLLGSLPGLARGREIGLVYFDGHSDFNTIETTQTGAVAGMDLALATGRGASELARLGGSRPLVRDEHVVAVRIPMEISGRRTSTPPPERGAKSEERWVAPRSSLLDSLNGIDPATLRSLLSPLVHHPRAIGMEMTIYDPRKDHDGRGAALLADILETAFAKQR